ncbi:phosphoglycolate phosphatase [Salana multivorans]|uniref:Phosphoglycolate phosphatase n=1 Tax=Salana multivorans TaxID=120377 RepID=A0A3N2D2J7_9MICO|nr:HAD hydrolase-like protein [Salana multivorans]ROR93979.1 phosphoglycolate phosphatase [Salana multivorans]
MGTTTAAPLVLLDLDGTLTDSAPGIMASAAAAFDALGLARPTPDELRSFVGPPLPVSMRALGVPPERLSEAVRAYRASFAAGNMWDNRVYDGIPEQLGLLRAAGCTLAVATSKPEVYARPICERFGLTARVDRVYGAPLDDVPSSKASVIAHSLADLRRRELVPDAERILMVGDRHHDVEGAREHDIDCLGVGWGYAVLGELADAVGIVPRVDDLAAAVLARLTG